MATDDPDPTADPIVIDHVVIESQGQQLYTAAAGPQRGPLVILLHGFPEFSYAWRRLLGPLAALGFRALAVDQRGYGKSSKPTGPSAYTADVLLHDVLALADVHGAAHFSVVGHDWGGIIGWHLATRHPLRLECLAILNAPHPGTLLDAMLKNPLQALKSSYIAGFQIPGLAEALLGAWNCALLERALVSTSRPGTFTPEELSVYHAAWAEPGALTGMLNWYRALPFGPSLHGKRVRVPTQILWGDRDWALSPRMAEDAAALCEDVEVVHFPDATHWLHHEEPARVAGDLGRFLRAKSRR